MNRAALTCEELAAGFDLDATQAAALSRYVDAILGWRKGNVTALRSHEDVVTKLIGDSLALLDVEALLRRAGARWLDLGTGAGVPGIPLAVALPHAQVTLLDSAAKKCEFLDEAVAAAGLEHRVRVVCARSERHAAAGAPDRESYGVVLARAVAPLAAVMELAAPLLAPGGVLAASKTSRALDDELGAAEVAAPLCGFAPGTVVRLPRSPLDDAVCAVYERRGPAPKQLPRREGLAVRRSLPGTPPAAKG